MRRIIPTLRQPCCVREKNTNRALYLDSRQMISLFLLIIILFPDGRVAFERNANDVANREFKFKSIASPVKDDAAATAKLTLIEGELDGGGADLSSLDDGRLPADEDEPSG